MKTCKHAGPHYRINPKGVPGEFWCENCIRDYGLEQSYMTQDLKELCDLLQQHRVNDDNAL